MPKVSICIPAYMQVAYLKECLLSISEQTIKDYELIISDDSPDDSVYNLIKQFDFGGRLKYFKNSSPLGSPKNWNFAIQHATSDLIKLMHHDDSFSSPQSLEKFISLMDENPTANFGFSASKVKNVTNNKSWIHTASERQVAQIQTNPELLILGNLIGSPSSTIYRRNINIEYDNKLKWLVDIDFYIRVIQQGNKIVNTQEAFITTPTNASHQVTEECINNCQLELYEYTTLYLKNQDQVSGNTSINNHLLGILAKYRIFNKKALHLEPYFTSQQIDVLEQLLVRFKNQPIIKFIYYVYWWQNGPLFLIKIIRFLIHQAYSLLSLIRLLYNPKNYKNQ
ncbi:glycosyltransferase family 2 protein [Methylophilus sp. 13]|uniref:glycosyltransferase family 2 protein n=1 Tax=Methylophilus sp. 13 TaxID=2781018 RepID=UPI00189036B3|nr:glycosyltransferase family 2 protein [Methylophilus sp. 13]MBF5038121.1 glycosyltransferase family 2 protein [Methylophilus sp. 13]